MADVRSIKTPAEEAIRDAFANSRAKLPGKSDVVALREEAFKSFDAQGLPHRRVEEWKYTDLRALMPNLYPLAPPPDSVAKTRAKDAGKLLSGVTARRLMFVDGAFVPEMSDLTPETGLTIGSMAEALAKGDQLVSAHVGRTIETNDPAIALNTALMGDGAVIRIAAGTALKRPVLMIFAANGNKPEAVFSRSLIVVEKGAKATVIECHDSADAQVNAALELIAADNTEIDYIKITEAKALHVGSLLVKIGKDAQFNSFAYTADAKIVRNQAFIRFDGQNSKGGIRGVSLLKGEEHVDNTLLIDHAVGGCESREQFKSVLDGESHGVFQGKIVVRQHAQKTDAKMMTRALMLSNDAEADNKPELEIFADDVVCGHGATAGALDENLKFYLMSRGIPEKEAEVLLVQAFIDEAIDVITQADIRDALKVAALRWLGARK